MLNSHMRHSHVVWLFLCHTYVSTPCFPVARYSNWIVTERAGNRHQRLTVVIDQFAHPSTISVERHHLTFHHLKFSFLQRQIEEHWHDLWVPTAESLERVVKLPIKLFVTFAPD
ncbi:Uncharacterized protein HZ326_21492 [Fusarium oxysporum f. sp. albedinis]|nr:Uncharacterized protein HZ326_21492 [Fusarium oxysporum f. sp. albedinis]